MSDKNKAEDLADQAIEVAIGGDDAKAREMAEQAKAMDGEAAMKIGDDADAEHEAAATYVEKSAE